MFTSFVLRPPRKTEIWNASCHRCDGVKALPETCEGVSFFCKQCDVAVESHRMEEKLKYNVTPNTFFIWNPFKRGEGLTELQHMGLRVDMKAFIKMIHSMPQILEGAHRNTQLKGSPTYFMVKEPASRQSINGQPLERGEVLFRMYLDGGVKFYGLQRYGEPNRYTCMMYGEEGIRLTCVEIIALINQILEDYPPVNIYTDSSD